MKNPVLLYLHGVFDHSCSYPEATRCIQKFEAPVKGSCTFEHSAHSPIFEEPVAAQRIMREDVLTGSNGLADPL